MVRHLLVAVACLAAVLLAAIVLPCAAQAEERVALVIGNSAYRNVPRLPNPANDAVAMHDLFEAAGFDVQVANDLGVNDLRKALRTFAEKAAGADIAIV